MLHDCCFFPKFIDKMHEVGTLLEEVPSTRLACLKRKIPGKLTLACHMSVANTLTKSGRLLSAAAVFEPITVNLTT